MQKIIIIIQLLIQLAVCQTCQNYYPTSQTLQTVKRIIEKYAIAINEKNEEGRSRILVIPRDIRIEIDNVRYYLNPDKDDDEMIFKFDIFRFYFMPVYVESYRNQILDWDSEELIDHQNLLSRIGRQCDDDQILCGLECCPRRIRRIQMNIIAENNLENILTTTFNGVQFSASKEKIQSVIAPEYRLCEYRLNKEDILFPMTSKIYYSCPKTMMCCTLSCESRIFPDLVSISAISYRRDESSWISLDQLILPILTLILFTIFALLIWIHHRQANKFQEISKSIQKSTILRESSDSDDLSEMFDTIQSSRSTKLLINGKKSIFNV